MTNQGFMHRGEDRINEHTWAVVLAAGEGSRLKSLTTTHSGTVIPKQFCSLHDGPSLLHQALNRGLSVAARPRLCAVVAAQHQRWWQGPLWSLSAANVIVQPENRGTANGILLPLQHILARDPQAIIVLLPSDHHVDDEPILAEALRDSVASLTHFNDAVVCLGIEPEEPDPELGYIVPQVQAAHGSYRVARFVEKPSASLARQLIEDGALWNAFIVVATARTLLSLFEARVPNVVADMQSAVQLDRHQTYEMTAAADLYRDLPTLDFSRHIMLGQEHRLRVHPVPPCGWSDLGTPKRVGDALQRVMPLKGRHDSGVQRLRASYGFLSLATQHALQQGAVTPWLAMS